VKFYPVATNEYDIADQAKAGHSRVLYSYVNLPPSRATRRSFGRWIRRIGITDLFLDSGAFGAWTRGAPVDMLDYERCIEAVEPDVYAQLDVIRDPEATLTNLARMERDGFRPLPILQRGLMDHDIADVCSRYSYIAVGGVVPKRGVQTPEQVTPFLEAVFHITRDVVGVHGFGVTTPSLVDRFPFASVDSSGADMAAVYGRAVVLDGYRVKPARESVTRSRASALRHPALVAGASSLPDRTQRRNAAIAEYQRMADRVTRLWHMRGVSW
jgi:hypothetical protein